MTPLEKFFAHVVGCDLCRRNMLTYMHAGYNDDPLSGDLCDVGRKLLAATPNPYE